MSEGTQMLHGTDWWLADGDEPQWHFFIADAGQNELVVFVTDNHVVFAECDGYATIADDQNGE